MGLAPQRARKLALVLDQRRALNLALELELGQERTQQLEPNLQLGWEH